jgi:hypothetical protein
MLFWGDMGTNQNYVAADNSQQVEQFGDVRMTRIAPSVTTFGQQIWVVIQLENTGTEEAMLEFSEPLGNADFDKDQATSILVDDPGYGQDVMPQEEGEGFYFWYYEWKVNLPAGHKTYLTYWITPSLAGEYVISPAEITINGTAYRTKTWVIAVKCNQNGQCQTEAGENVVTCPDDCAKSSADGICQAIADGVIDEDCDEGFDPDTMMQITNTPQEFSPTATTQGKVKLNPAFCPGSAGLIFLTLLLIFLKRRM